MSIELTMPRLSDTMEQGTIIRWNAKEGDEVASGDVIADIETDKATMEMQVFDDGVLAKIIVEEGQQVPVGTPIAMIAEEGEDAEGRQGKWRRAHRRKQLAGTTSVTSRFAGAASSPGS